MSTSPPGGSLATRHPGYVIYFIQVISLNCLARDRGLSINTQTATGRRKHFVVEEPRYRDGSSGQKARESRSTSDHANLDRGVKISTPRSKPDPIAKTVKFFIDTSHLEECNPPHRRVHKVWKAIKNTKLEYPLR